VLGILKNVRAEIAKSGKVINLNPPEKPKPLTVEDVPAGEELADWIARAQGSEGIPVLARFARGALRSWVNQGLIPRELVPADLLEPDTPAAVHATAAGAVAKLSPRPFGGPSPTRSDYSVHNPTIKIALQDSNLQPADTVSAGSTVVGPWILSKSLV